MACDGTDCGKTTPIMIVMCDGREYCARCWLDGAYPGKLGNVQVNTDVDAMPKGALAGKSLLTNDVYAYTGETMNLRTGERSKAKREVASFAKDPNKRPATKR